MALTKINLVDMCCNKLDGSKKDYALLIESFFEIIKEDLGKGNDVNISGFGKWTVNDKLSRKGRNPQTGEDLIISARRVVTFKASPILKKTL